MKKILLVVLDGWGLSDEAMGNAVKNAETPNMDRLISTYPATSLQASGLAVGLPYGQMGNSEVGHLTLGAGKIFYQNLLRITIAIQNKAFFHNEVLVKAIDEALAKHSDLHLMGLISTGGVHSHLNHLYALLDLLKQKRFPTKHVFIHGFTDGRDTPPDSGIKFVADIERNLYNDRLPGRIASLMGRYYAMDRNNNWDRTQKAYNCLVSGVGKFASDAQDALEQSYKDCVSDEFVEPTLIADATGKISTIKPGDSVIFFNIREDRARQLTQAFVLQGFNFFDTSGKLPNLNFTTMIDYEADLPVNVAFPPEEVEEPLGKILSDRGLKQLRLAETEKYAHVTYFFNGGREKPFPGEERLLVPSQKVSDYSQTPRMSAEEITQALNSALQKKSFDFILVNFANADMVGHTGNFKAGTEAVSFLDQCMGRITQAALENGYTTLITADHGNAEEMINLRHGANDTEHSSNPVPLIVVDEALKRTEPLLFPRLTIGGMLSDVAPTILGLMQIEKPVQMTGTDLMEFL